MGQGVETIDGVIQNVNPATGALIADPPIAVTTPDELVDVIAKANVAQCGWGDLSVAERIAFVRKGIAAVEPLADQLAASITREMGKVSAEAAEEVADANGLKGEWLDMVAAANADIDVVGGDGATSRIVRDPLGVVAVISPWNYPVGEIPLLALPALVAGNAVILKPSEVTPVTGALYCQALAAALPPGVLQLVQGAGDVGGRLVEASDVHMVAMTGSTTTGKRIMESCAANLKRLVLELGGKDPMVVFADADLDQAAADAVANSVYNQGQSCCSVERVYIEDSVKAEFEKKVVKLAKEQKVGVPTEEGVTVGPMVSQMQLANVKKHVADAVAHGATKLYESPCPAAGGNYHPVTVLSDLTQDMLIQRAETFGPVVALSGFDGTEARAIALANDTEYGLCSYVYTGDLQKGARVARKFRSGQVGINCYSIAKAQPECPWVGHKGSGFGTHSGMDGFRSFSVPKSLVFTGGAP